MAGAGLGGDCDLIAGNGNIIAHVETDKPKVSEARASYRANHRGSREAILPAPLSWIHNTRPITKSSPLFPGNDAIRNTSNRTGRSFQRSAAARFNLVMIAGSSSRG